jgi:hypothetical protein
MTIAMIATFSAMAEEIKGLFVFSFCTGALNNRMKSHIFTSGYSN